jgi:hypothetical protein
MRHVARHPTFRPARLEIDPLALRSSWSGRTRRRSLHEVALESLLRQWADLASWIAAERDDLKEADNLERAAASWEQNDRNAAWLLEGERLSRSESLVLKPGFQDRLSHTSGFLSASRAREDKRIADEKALSRSSGRLGNSKWRKPTRPRSGDCRS